MAAMRADSGKLSVRVLGAVIVAGGFCLLARSSSSAQAAPVAASPGAVATASAAPVKPVDLKAVLKRMQLHYELTKTFTATFSEEIVPVGGTKQPRQGTIAYQKPGRMHWQFAVPHQQTIVSDGRTIFSYEPDLNQVIKTPVMRAFKSSAPAAFLLGMGNIERDFRASIPRQAPADGQIHLQLQPKSGGDKVLIGLNPATYDLASVKLVDQLGNVTIMRFADVRTNIALDPKLFQFEIPKGADIVSAPEA